MEVGVGHRVVEAANLLLLNTFCQVKYGSSFSYLFPVEETDEVGEYGGGECPGVSVLSLPPGRRDTGGLLDLGERQEELEVSHSE